MKRSEHCGDCGGKHCAQINKDDEIQYLSVRSGTVKTLKKLVFERAISVPHVMNFGQH
jgi:hypothetical protein